MDTGLFCRVSIFGGRYCSYLFRKSILEPKDKEIGSDLPMFLGVPSDNQMFLGVPSDNQMFLGVPSDKQMFLGVPSDKQMFLGVPSDNQMFLSVPSDNQITVLTELFLLSLLMASDLNGGFASAWL
jgi:hypothetical protein